MAVERLYFLRVFLLAAGSIGQGFRGAGWGVGRLGMGFVGRSWFFRLAGFGFRADAGRPGSLGIGCLALAHPLSAHGDVSCNRQRHKYLHIFD